MIRVLLTIPHFWCHDNSLLYGSRRTPRDERLEAVRACLQSVFQHLGSANIAANLASPHHSIANQLTSARVDVVLCIHGTNHLLDSVDSSKWIHRQPFHGDPKYLGYACHNILRSHLGEYDVYGYLEDDLIIRDAWWLTKLAWFQSIAGPGAVLQPNRFEVSRHDMQTKVYIDGELPASRTRRYQDVEMAPEIRGPFLGKTVSFRRTLNPHAGCFFLTAQQMARWATSPHFLDLDKTFFSPLEGAATVGVMRSFRVYKPDSKNAAFFELEHFGDAWMNKIASRDCNVGVAPLWTTHRSKENRVVGWAIDYVGDAFDTRGERLLGRHVAGKEFLNALSRHSSPSTLYCHTPSKLSFCSFANQVHNATSGHKTARWIPYEQLADLSEPGCLFHASPDIATSAWKRRRIGQRNHSLLGVAHTTCSMRVMDFIGALCTAPIQKWDAVICTSNAVKSTFDHVLHEWCDYLAARIGGSPRCHARLPVIPLGVHSTRYSSIRADASEAKQARQQWQIAKDEIVFIYVGRLSFHAKANPLPMYQALQAAQRHTDKRVRLLLIGWFANETIRDTFQRGCAEFCPNVTVSYRDGRNPANVDTAWKVGDVFTLIADNIQETFGLAPIEAMAAGLPVVVSDWNGFRDTVRDKVDGYRIATTVPCDSGSMLIDRYFNGIDSYDRYVGATSQAVSVDLDQLVRAYIALIENASLRQTMGESGRQRARDVFDWSVVIRQYEALLTQMSEERSTASESAALRSGGCAIPLRDDPFRVFRSYATHLLGTDTRVYQGVYAQSYVTDMLSNPLSAPIRSLLASGHAIVDALDLLSEPRTAAELISGPFRGYSPAQAMHTVAWMTKVGLARTSAPEPTLTD